MPLVNSHRRNDREQCGFKIFTGFAFLLRRQFFMVFKKNLILFEVFSSSSPEKPHKTSSSTHPPATDLTKKLLREITEFVFVAVLRIDQSL